MNILIIGRLLCALAAVIAAGYLAYFDKDGWGWFLFCAIWLGCLSASTESNN